MTAGPAWCEGQCRGGHRSSAKGRGVSPGGFWGLEGHHHSDALLDHESSLCKNKELYSRLYFGSMPGLVMGQCLILLLLFLGGLLSDTQEAQRPLPGRDLGGSRLVIRARF